MIDYTKPGKTPPGTKHPQPPRPVRLTWLDFVRPGIPPLNSNRVEHDDVQYPVNARKNRRLNDAYRARRQRKGQRRFYQAQLKQAVSRDVIQAQMAVLAAGPDAPGNAHRYRNVYNSMVAKYGDKFLQAVGQ